MAVEARPARLVGRAAELAVLEVELRRALAGEVRVVLVRGDPGIGKTRLALEFLARHRRSTLTLSARASPFGASAAFELWIEALEGHLRGLDPDSVLALCRGRAETLSLLLPSAAALSVPALRTPSRPWLLESLAVLLGELAKHRPLVVFLDDLHLGDPSSWEALHYTARSLARSRLLVVAAARTGELSAQRPLVDLLGALAQDGLLRTIEVTALVPPQVEELVAAVLGTLPPAGLVPWLVERSGGNALFATGLLRALLEDGADLAHPLLRRLPVDLRERVLVRAERLEPAARELLAVLAVAGTRLDLPTLRGAAGLSTVEVEAALASLVAGRFAAEQEAGLVPVYEVAHPLIQEALYEGLSGPRRRALHRRVAATLTRGGRRQAAALHYARSADPGDEEALGALFAALDEAERQQSYAEALGLGRATADVIEDGDPRTYTLLERIAWLAQVVQNPVGIHALRRMQKIAATDSGPERRVDISLRLASFLYTHGGAIDQARRELDRTRRLVAADRRPERLLALRNELAWLAGVGGDVQGQLEQGMAVLEAAREAGAHLAYRRLTSRAPVIQHCLGCVAHAAALVGRFEAAEPVAREGLRLARADGDDSQFEWFAAQLGFSRLLSGRAAEAEATFEEFASGFRTTEPIEYWSLALWALGQLDAALGKALESAAWTPAGLSTRRAWALGVAAICAAELGRPQEARFQLERAAQVFGGRGFYWMAEVVGWAQGVSAWSAGELGEATGRLEAAWRRLDGMGAAPLAALVAFDAAELCETAGDGAAALDWARRLAKLASGLASPLYGALAAPRDGRSAETVGELGWRLHRARLLARHDSLEALSTALEELHAMGAGWRAGVVAGRLRQLGSGGRRAAALAMGAGVLSDREREVARLAAHGMTAREVAEQLFLSRRTVETHLANVYGKLGLASKRELVRRGRELGLIQ